MDFLQSTLKDEIEKKRKALQAAKANDTSAANKKYISRAELERLREKEYLEEQERDRKKKQVCLVFRSRKHTRSILTMLTFTGASSRQTRKQASMFTPSRPRVLFYLPR
jgi:hypothetical protein